jgi:hypothetical protein
MTNLPLSLAAQAILNAATLYIYDVVADDAPGAISRVSAEAAVVLRAAVDQVIPEEQPVGGAVRVREIQQDQRAEIRHNFLALAAELEAL